MLWQYPTISCDSSEGEKVPWSPGRYCMQLIVFLLCLKFPSYCFQLQSHLTSLKCSLTTSGKIDLSFLEYCMHIAVPSSVTLYYSYLFACLSAFPARLWTYVNQRLHFSSLWNKILECLTYIKCLTNHKKEVKFLEGSPKSHLIYKMQLKYIYN